MAKKFEVIKATTRELSGVTVGGRQKMFKPNGTFETTDAGEAKEIDKVLGAKGTGEVVVTSYDEKEPGHNYTFSGVDTSRFKVWVLKRGKLVRVTKLQAREKGYKVVSVSKRRPDISQVRNAEGAPV
jgi:hypothetical protein